MALIAALPPPVLSKIDCCGNPEGVCVGVTDGVSVDDWVDVIVKLPLKVCVRVVVGVTVWLALVVWVEDGEHRVFIPVKMIPRNGDDARQVRPASALVQLDKTAAVNPVGTDADPTEFHATELDEESTRA